MQENKGDVMTFLVISAAIGKLKISFLNGQIWPKNPLKVKFDTRMTKF